MPEKMTAAEFQADAAKVKGVQRVKGAQITEFDGIKFHSKKEAKRYAELTLLERSGDIAKLERQVKFPLIGKDGPILTPTGRQMHYVADFRYIDWRLGGIWVVEDAKGYQTEVFKLKRAILKAQNIDITET